jgi:DNA-binding protein H-NS
MATTLEAIQAKMKKLQVQADALIAKKAQAALDQIRALMLKHGLTTEDIEAKAKAKREVKAANGSASNVTPKAAGSLKSGTPPKYQHPKTGATWTGHGRAPAWIAEAKDRSKFLIASGADAALAASVGTVSKAKTAAKKGAAVAGAVAHKGQRKGPQPAKYLDPKSGATWSGRGPAPAWLAAAKDRTRFLIDCVSAAAEETEVANKAKPETKKVAATKAASTKKVVVKKAAAEKAVNAKAPAKKAAAKNAVPAEVKKAPAKKAPRKSAAVAAPVATVESGAESTT